MSKRSLPFLSIFVFLLLSLLALTAGAQSSPSTAPNPDPALQPALNPQEGAAANSPSLNGLAISSWQRIAYQKWAQNNWDIYLFGSNGSTRLTTDPADDFYPSLNRGGTHVAFSSGRNEPSGQLNLYTMKVDKTGMKQIHNGWTAFPAWSPDGQAIAFQAWVGDNYEIFVVDADGSNLRRLTNNPDFDGQPTWSPDGERIAFASRRGGAYAIYNMNKDGADLKKVSSFPLSLHPTWSPDGQTIGFDADVDNDGWQELAIVKRDGSGEKMVYNPGPSATSWAGSWSPDANYLGFTNISLIQSGGSWVWTKGEILQWEMDNSAVTNLVPGDTDWYMDWQTLDTIPPSATMSQTPEYARADQFGFAWSGTDTGGSGIKNYNVLYRSSSIGTWQTFWGNTIATEAKFEGIPGETVDFLVRARDNALNMTPWSAAPMETTTFYSTKISGRIVDNRGAPLDMVGVNVSPAPLFPIQSDDMGDFVGYTTSPGAHTIDMNPAGFLPVPQTTTKPGEDFKRTISLFPADNLLVNGTFEASGFLPVGWQTAGGMDVAVTGIDQVTGKYSVRMSTATNNAAQAANAITTGDLSQQVTIPVNMESPTLSFTARADGDAFNDGTGFQAIVKPDGGSEIVVFPPALIFQNWTHYWLDMSGFKGLTVDIIFRTTQDSNDPPITIFLDDVSLGSASPELWLEMSALPRSAVSGETVMIELDYGNRGAIAASSAVVDVTLDPALNLVNSVPPAVQNGQQLQWNLPALAANSGPETILLTTTVTGSPAQAMKVTGKITSGTPEAHTANNEMELFIGNQKEIFLPVMGGWSQ